MLLSCRHKRVLSIEVSAVIVRVRLFTVRAVQPCCEVSLNTPRLDRGLNVFSGYVGLSLAEVQQQAANDLGVYRAYVSQCRAGALDPLVSECQFDNARRLIFAYGRPCVNDSL